MFGWLFGGLIGAALEYFFDPGSGARRRHTARDKLFSYGRKGAHRATGLAEMAAHKAQGIVMETVPIRRDNPNPDDITLKDRIESELFRDPSLGRDEININVVDGVVVVHGALPAQDEIERVITQVRSIRDVEGVESYLHTPGTPAPNKADALRVS
jgi:osmotically-inducible protein OsmY